MMRLLLLLLFALSNANVLAVETLHIGIFAYRPGAVIEHRWSALQEYLQEQIPGKSFRLHILDLDELEQGLQENRFDFLFTNPRHYIQLRSRYPLSGAIGTLVRSVNGIPVPALGGLILTTSDNQYIQQLTDLKGESILAPGSGFLGGYQTQMYALLKAGISDRDVNIIFTGGPHDNVIEALLRGEAGVGFVRSGILEQMIAEGSIRRDQFRVINQQALNDYPYEVSTMLYPEWPFIALPKVDSMLARKVASALLSITPESAVAERIGIHGFDIPADYHVVEKTMRELKLPPFDKTETITFRNLWEDYQGVMLAVCMSLVVIAVLIMVILRKNHSLQRSEQNSRELLRQLGSSHKFLRTVFSAIPDLVWIKDKDGVYLDCNDRFESFFGHDRDSIVGKTDYDYVDQGLADFFRANDQIAVDRGESVTNEESITFASDGHNEILETTKTPIYDVFNRLVGIIGIGRDITQRKQMEEQLRLYQKVYSQTHEGIIVTNMEGVIVDVNPAFTEITGFIPEQAIGQKPDMLGSGMHEPQFFHDMWQQLLEHGYWKGEVWNRNSSGELFAELLSITLLQDADGQPQYYVGIFSDITQNKNQQEELNNLAHYDPLTGLANRILFTERYKQAIAHAHRNRNQVAICFIDLDNFKPVNDLHGHDAGDQVLVEVANRLIATIREEDTASRQGGDEFTVLLTNVESRDGCRTTIERIMDSLSSRFQVDDDAHLIGASIGIALSTSDEDDFDTLLRQADHAMYQAKLAGKNQYRFYDATHDLEILRRNTILNEIRRALDRNELQLYYQPKVDMTRQSVFGAEALIRWIHPDRGVVPPLKFLPMLEQSELECEVGNWVIHNALAQLNEWLEQGINLQLSINISSFHLQQDNFIDNLEQALRLYPRVDSEMLELEILESSVLGDLQNIARTIKTCQSALGVKFALDDFGTGYSSLAHLRSLSVNTIKIDQTFVRDMLDDPNDHTIVNGVIGLARSFGRNLIAEGVETVEHGLMLMLMGCDRAQGYGIARPMMAQQFREWLDSYSLDERWHHFNQRMNYEQKLLRQIILTVDHFCVLMTQSIEAGREQQPTWPVLDVHCCFCGRWIDDIHQRNDLPDETMKRLDQAHQDLHEVASTLQLLYQSDQLTAASNLLAGLESQRQTVIEILMELFAHSGDAVAQVASTGQEPGNDQEVGSGRQQ